MRDLCASLQKCLEIRDKYMRLSRQRLGDDPRDYDGIFRDLDEEQKGVAGVRPDCFFSTKGGAANREFNKWNIYPPPPPPHWHWKGKQPTPPLTSESIVGEEEFDYFKCEIPEEDSQHNFRLDDKGVYQIYDGEPGEC